jgi:hypothetical protein
MVRDVALPPVSVSDRDPSVKGAPRRTSRSQCVSVDGWGPREAM